MMQYYINNLKYINRFFYNVVLTELPIAIINIYWQVLFFLEYFPQTNVFA